MSPWDSRQQHFCLQILESFPLSFLDCPFPTFPPTSLAHLCKLSSVRRITCRHPEDTLWLRTFT